MMCAQNRDRAAFWGRIAAQMILGFVVAMAVSACATQKMVVPATLAGDSDVVAVDRPSFKSSFVKQTFKVGEFAASNVDVGGESTNKTSVGPFTKKRSSQRFSFDLVRGDEAVWKVGCEISESTKSIHGWTAGGAELTCSFEDVGVGKSGTLEVALWKHLNERELAGKAVIGGAELSVLTTKEREGTAPSVLPSGFIFVKSGQELGAVDVLNKGVFYLSRRASDEDRVELIATGLAVLIAHEQEGDM